MNEIPNRKNCTGNLRFYRTAYQLPVHYFTLWIKYSTIILQRHRKINVYLQIVCFQFYWKTVSTSRTKVLFFVKKPIRFHSKTWLETSPKIEVFFITTSSGWSSVRLIIYHPAQLILRVMSCRLYLKKCGLHE